MNQWMSDKGDCRTALATPGLLIKIQEALNLLMCAKISTDTETNQSKKVKLIRSQFGKTMKLNNI